MNNVQLYSVYLQNTSFIKTILRFTLACNEAVPDHPPPSSHLGQGRRGERYLKKCLHLASEILYW